MFLFFKKGSVVIKFLIEIRYLLSLFRDQAELEPFIVCIAESKAVLRFFAGIAFTSLGPDYGYFWFLKFTHLLCPPTLTYRKFDAKLEQKRQEL